ncbi:MAG: ATP-binding cassette domain-containing protein [Pirellulaceae bacterium]
MITLSNLSIRFRGPMLLDEVSCQIEPGEKIGLLGRNGSGKTTLMRMLCGDVEPDHGEVAMAPEVRVSLLPQDVPQDIHGTIEEVVTRGAAAAEPASGDDALDAAHAWQVHHRVQQTLSRMELDPAARFETLSSGMKRRVLLARAIATGPDLLLLDEPTNHLDIEAITWLEDFLGRWPGTLMFVTHDRMFLRKLAGRILEVDRGRLFDWSCDYETFLQRKEAALAAEEKQNALFDKKLAEEEAWIRQGIRARRTRNEGRVRALKDLRRQRAERRETTGAAQIQIQEGQRSGALVAKVDRVSFAYGERVIVSDFSTTLMRGDKVGVIGPNGAGKTTLLRILLGQLAPDQGGVRLGTNLQVAYFDQLRGQLDEEKTVQENVGDGYDTIKVGGGTRHIVGYLQDFLFDPDRARTLVRFLSGGERNRALLAKLFAKPANVIVLDEPTNDLDAETLELLEERLIEFTGTVLLVSHDREFLNNVVTSTIAFEPGGAKEYVGGYDDWLRQRPAPAVSEAIKEQGKSKSAPPTKSESPTPSKSSAKRRLKYKEQQELDALPGKIEQLEADIAALHEAMARPDFYQQSGEAIARETERLQQLDEQLAAAYQRWEELEHLADG